MASTKGTTKEEYNLYMREYMLKRYHKVMTEIREYLGGICVDCGSTENLQIDHIDPKTKKFTVGTYAVSKNKKELWEEVNKCQLLCQECHNIKTIDDLGLQEAKGKHGTLSSYRYCKCEECREAHNEYNRQYKRKLRNNKNSGV